MALSGRMTMGKDMWESLYATLKNTPMLPMYGVFPVKLTTHIGKPIYPAEGMTDKELAALTVQTMEDMIAQYQTLPGSLYREVMERVTTTASKISDFMLEDREDAKDDEKPNGMEEAEAQKAEKQTDAIEKIIAKFEEEVMLSANMASYKTENQEGKPVPEKADQGYSSGYDTCDNVCGVAK